LNFEIISAGESALNFIGSYSEGETIGEAVKVFENTVYLKTGHDDLICLTSKDVKAPMNLNLNTPVDFLKLDCISKKAIRTPTGLKLETIVFDTKNSKIYPTTKDYKMKNGLQNRILFVVDEINLLDTLGSILDNHTPFFNELSYAIRTISESTQKRDLMKLSNQLSSIVGLGNRFTPSGDDFIVGFLFCLKRILFHTNHYLKDELLPAELIRKSSIGSSVLRYMVLEKFFNRENKMLSQDVLMNLMRDHTSYPRSICSHEVDSADDTPRSCTIAAMIQSLNKRTMRITNGCACESAFHEFTLS